MTKHKIILIAATVTATLLSFSLIPNHSAGQETIDLDPVLAQSVEIKEPLPYGIPNGLDPKTERILIDLIKCESQGNANALNKVDRDGTPSYGLLQFKPSTLYGVIKQYKLMPDLEESEVLNVIYDGDLQIKAFLAFYGEGKPIEWWKQQFPACSKKYGYWLN